MKKKVLLMVFLLSTMCLQAQSPEKLLRRGNRQYRKANYEKAEELYRSISTDSVPGKKVVDLQIDARFNLGDALYMQERYSEAFEVFQSVAELTPDAKMKSKAVFNMGNCLLVQDQYFNAFGLFKEALRHNPDNEDALYNLEYCRAHLVKSRVLINPEITHGKVEASEKEAFNGQMVALNNTADAGYVFTRYIVSKNDDQQVTVDVSGNRFVMPKFDVVVSAEFKQLHNITVDTKTKHGKISADKKQSYEGQRVTLHAQPEPKYMVDRYHVYKTGSPKDTVPVNDSVFQMPDFDVTVTATFRTAWKVSVDSTANGTVRVTDTLALPGQNIGVIVKPDPGYQLENLTVVSDKDPLLSAPVSDENVFQMLDSDVTVKATFTEAMEYYKVVADTAIEGGKVVLEVDRATWKESVLLKNEPEPGYQFKEYKICQLGDTSVHVQPLGNFFTMPSFDVLVSAVFEKQDGENQNQQNQQDQQQDQQDQQDQQQNQQQDQQDQQDQQQDQQNQQQNQQQDQQNQQQNQQRQSQQDLSREDAQRMLEALEGQEKQTIEKVNELKLRQQQKSKTDKDW